MRVDRDGFRSNSFFETVHAVLSAVQEGLIHEVIVMLKRYYKAYDIMVRKDKNHRQERISQSAVDTHALTMEGHKGALPS